MVDVIQGLRARARVLHRSATAGDSEACRRLRALPELEAVDALAGVVRRRHCLAVVAREAGFDGWSHAVAVLRGREVTDFGTTLYPWGAWAHWNIWSASYDEARGIRADCDGYLLPYRHQFVIVDRAFVETLGLDPDDPDWAAIGRDWVRPAQPDARARLYAKLLGVSDRSG